MPAEHGLHLSAVNVPASRRSEAPGFISFHDVVALIVARLRFNRVDHGPPLLNLLERYIYATAIRGRDLRFAAVFERYAYDRRIGECCLFERLPEDAPSVAVWQPSA